MTAAEKVKLARKLRVIITMKTSVENNERCNIMAECESFDETIKSVEWMRRKYADSILFDKDTCT